jgi:hypothetical protein
VDRLEELAAVVARGEPEALAVVPELRDELSRRVIDLVGAARAAGWGWPGIGAALGITKQAAHRHYAALVELHGDAGWDTPPQHR